MNVHNRIALINAKRDMLMRSKAHRKLILSNPSDRRSAAHYIVLARQASKYLGIKGYDRFLVVASVLAHSDSYDYVADELARQAQD